MKWLPAISLVFLATMTYLLISENALFEAKQKQPPTTPGNQFWQENNDVLVYLEAITHIKEHSLYLSPGTPRQTIIRSSLQAYAEQIDPYAAYLTAEEFRQWQAAQGDRYVGIGMEIEKNKDNQVLCLPYPDSPAEKAGIRPGDRLLSIDDIPVEGRSILAIGSMARGKPGSRVKLVIMPRSGPAMQINAIRTALTADTVAQARVGAMPVIKITAFTRDTKIKLENVLAALNRSQPLIIDLRGNAGGDLSAAIDSAMLFLAANNTIVSIKTRHGVDNYESNKNALNEDSPLFILQDDGTASAAEVFTAALTQNRRAKSVGRKSFGKGTRQEVFQMSDGSALFLSTGFLQTPDGQFFDGSGLDPDYPVASKTPQTSDFVAKVEELINVKP